MVFWISLVSVHCHVCLYILISFISIFSFSFLVNLYKGQSILLIFPKKQLFVLIFLFFILLISAQNQFISCCLLMLSTISSFFCRAFRCAVKLLIWYQGCPCRYHRQQGNEPRISVNENLIKPDFVSPTRSKLLENLILWFNFLAHLNTVKL